MFSKPLDMPAMASAATCQTEPLRFKLMVPSLAKKSPIASLPFLAESAISPKTTFTVSANLPNGPMVMTLMLSFAHVMPLATFSNALPTRSPNLVMAPVMFSLPKASTMFVKPVVTVASKFPIAPSKVLVERAASSAASLEPKS